MTKGDLFNKEVIHEILALKKLNGIGEYCKDNILYVYFAKDDSGHHYKKGCEINERIKRGELKFLETECYADDNGEIYTGSPKTIVFIFPYEILKK